ncbi:hypothetical protein [Roseibacillus ishigakijimensis]|uniref:Uncharacterized protein n=1 Tax=Roseibacillus ishigakijimensis TaxID=454146 RepID=A0A934RS78_9BACT|nr:hypothetical protein [Roseibacillus ishigakijimensis]MBK1833556.1 hypothetical protein [Roseibacillus ishigakijimensis]
MTANKPTPRSFRQKISPFLQALPALWRFVRYQPFGCAYYAEQIVRRKKKAATPPAEASCCREQLLTR